ncbi:MAG: hypothetical protein F6K11_35605 [Leptolyngbya sp. SIO3F4]|nr:hypothetical protein [Leptolyngbya sp. SIO3F4]
MPLFYSEKPYKSTFSTFGSNPQKTDSWLTRVYQLLKQRLIVDDEVTVKQVIDCDGNIRWEVYDPCTRQKWTASQEAVLAWMDTDHHRENITNCKTINAFSPLHKMIHLEQL